MRLCAIIPSYNTVAYISALVKSIISKGIDAVVVDDGSSDNTAALAKDAGATVLKHDTNMGKGASLKDGFNFAVSKGYDTVITIDGDGQHSVDDIPLFLEIATRPDAGIVIGNRMTKRHNMPILRWITNRTMSLFISALIGQKIPDTQCGFRLIKADLLKRIALNTKKFELESELLIRASDAGCKIVSVPIKTIYRGESSKINPVVDSLRFIRFIIRLFSRKWAD